MCDDETLAETLAAIPVEELRDLIEALTAELLRRGEKVEGV